MLSRTEYESYSFTVRLELKILYIMNQENT